MSSRAVRGEVAVDRGEALGDARLGRGHARRAQYALDPVGMLGDPRLDLVERGLRDIMGGEAEIMAFGAVEPRAGQREELADPARQPRQIPAAADVGEQADRGFGHREAGMLGRDAVARGLRDADAAAHRDPVHERHGRHLVGEQQMVEPIFLVEEGARVRSVGRAAGGEHAHVAAGAEAAALGMVDQHRLDRGILAPLDQSGDHRAAHVLGQRVDRLGAVQPDAPGLAVDVGDDVAHWRSMSRAMITRMIWLVPSRIEWTRRSRQKRSIG